MRIEVYFHDGELSIYLGDVLIFKNTLNFNKTKINEERKSILISNIISTITSFKKD